MISTIFQSGLGIELSQSCLKWSRRESVEDGTVELALVLEFSLEKFSVLFFSRGEIGAPLTIFLDRSVRFDASIGISSFHPLVLFCTVDASIGNSSFLPCVLFCTGFFGASGHLITSWLLKVRGIIKTIKSIKLNADWYNDFRILQLSKLAEFER